MTSRAAAATLTGILCACLPACGFAGIQPVRLLGASAATPDAVEVDGALYSVSIADRWVRVAIENLSDDTLYLESDGLLFRNSAGVRHRLVPGNVLAWFEAAAERRAVPDDGLRLHARDATPAVPRHRPAKVALRRLPVPPPLVRIEPGGSHEDYFYPAEHLNLTPVGRWSASPLFCEHPRGEAPDGTAFEIAVPLRDRRAVQRVLLAGQLGMARPSQR